MNESMKSAVSEFDCRAENANVWGIKISVIKKIGRQ